MWCALYGQRNESVPYTSRASLQRRRRFLLILQLNALNQVDSSPRADRHRARPLERKHSAAYHSDGSEVDGA